MKTKQEQQQNKPEMTPETQLWVSVIIVALHDSRMDFMWFEKQDDQFQMVCNMANLDPEWVFNLYRDVLHKDDIDPTEILKRFFMFKF